jgi:AcrR family transcriptional regulator
LVEATARVLVSDGFDKASTNRIAELAGVSVGSLYQYFPSKEALVVAVIERHHRDIMRMVEGALAGIDSMPVAAAVRRLVAVAIEAHRVDPELHRVVTEQIPRSGPLDEVDTLNREAHARLRAYLERHREELGLADVTLAAFVCATAIEAVSHNAVLHRGEVLTGEAAARLVEETTRLIVGYLAPA